MLRISPDRFVWYVQFKNAIKGTPRQTIAEQRETYSLSIIISIWMGLKERHKDTSDDGQDGSVMISVFLIHERVGF
jgi:hypothetical protein